MSAPERPAAASRVIACGCGEPYPCGHIDPATIPPSDAASVRDESTQPNRVTFTFRCRLCGNEMYDGVCGSHESEGVQVEYTPRDQELVA